MKFTTECPACSNTVEVPNPALSKEGLRCPKCDIGFVPEKINHEFTASAESGNLENDKEQLKEQEKWQQYNRLREDAGTCLGGGAATLAFCVISVLVAVANDMNAIGFTIAGGMLSLSIILFFFSQCLHIRAGLEKLSIKE
jgi:hypothetical protein